MKFSKYILSFSILSYTLYHRIQYVARIFYYVFFMFFYEKCIDKRQKICYCNKGSPSPIYILVLLQHFNVLKHDLQARWTKSPHFTFVPYSIGSNQSGLGFRSSFVVPILSYFTNNVKYYFSLFQNFFYCSIHNRTIL